MPIEWKDEVMCNDGSPPNAHVIYPVKTRVRTQPSSALNTPVAACVFASARNNQSVTSSRTIRTLRIALRALLALLLFTILAYLLWSPGEIIADGRHDRGTNAIWLGHAWLSDDGWFARNPHHDPSSYRDPARITALAARLRKHHITDLFPHMAPANTDGRLPPIDAAQTERFLDGFDDFRVIPWIGGVLNLHCFPDRPDWRAAFIASITELLSNHPRLAGVQLNIEPLPTGNAGFLLLLEELRAALPDDKLLCVAAYPPPTRWHPHPDVHWDETYFRAVAARSDQLAVMMYDTALHRPKLYRHLMTRWTRDVIAWSGDKPVLLGLPAYDDAGTDYHNPAVENLPNALMGIHAGLPPLSSLPPNYRGVAIYSEWEMDEAEWVYFREYFQRTPR